MSKKTNGNTSKRPLSPHLTIYKPQITSVLSISHRLTGLGLFVGALLLAWWIVFNVYGTCDCINPIIFSTFGRVFLILWTLALYYHMLNGIRHLFWDMGKGFEIKTVNKSGIIVLLGAFGLTIASWVYVTL
ncbi:MAG: succinate dehydrogenase, cytochrome b556 subunit [Alphaproteobacteria bacterium CG11_big_fil_rev_8_21_14_0_20_39_49]|nr:MAG: succinate dehydrogenase, cytochrome b556 subunit [Alphaproteobacteria bacterium CG11_big_fil_rev_8_21_14_0_20_39_49]